MPGLWDRRRHRAGRARRIAAADAIFVGGGGSNPGVLDTVLGALRTGGRVVVNAATLQTEALLLARYSDLGGELTRIAISRADPVGSMTSRMIFGAPPCR